MAKKGSRARPADAVENVAPQAEPAQEMNPAKIATSPRAAKARQRKAVKAVATTAQAPGGLVAEDRPEAVELPRFPTRDMQDPDARAPDVTPAGLAPSGPEAKALPRARRGKPRKAGGAGLAKAALDRAMAVQSGAYAARRAQATAAQIAATQAAVRDAAALAIGTRLPVQAATAPVSAVSSSPVISSIAATPPGQRQRAGRKARAAQIGRMMPAIVASRLAPLLPRRQALMATIAIASVLAAMPWQGILAQQAPASAPAPSATAARPTIQVSRDKPVTFTSDDVEYDQDAGIVRANGNVEAWQENRILRADHFTYNRNTGVATAEGHVQLMDPDGQVVFADRAELTGNMKDGVVEGLGGLLAQNGKLAASGARRTNGLITDMANVLYSACDLCKENPEAPPIWQIRAKTAVQDKENLRLRYYDASVLVDGVPVLYTPYLSMPDPSAPRASGFLSPTFGTSRFLGGFTETPYYWAIDDQQDLTLSPTISTRQNPNLGLAYRRRFNAGEIEATGSMAWLSGKDLNDQDGFAGHIYAKGRFALDEHWRTGFELNRASSYAYLNAYRIPSSRTLPTLGYLEGFWGTQGYARVDARSYQGLRSEDDVALIPFVLPNVYSEYAFLTDGLGGHATVDAGGYSIYRDKGTNARRIATRLSYDLPMNDNIGGLWTLRSQSDLVGHSADSLNLAPNFASMNSATDTSANTRLALDWKMPFVRNSESGMTQLIEPHVQVVTGPAMGKQSNISNEDSLDFEFTDANLFSLNRYPGRDRMEGGTRVDVALRGALFMPSGGKVEAMVGQSYRAAKDQVFEAGSGLEDRASDIVSRLTVSPVSWLDFVVRGRWDKDTGDRRLIDTATSVSMGRVKVTAGYLYSTPNPVLTPIRTRREVNGSVNAQVTDYWRVGAYGRYDIDIDRPVLAGGNLTYEDECLILEARYSRSWAEDTGSASYYPSATLLLLRVGLKTVGDFGFRAL